MALFGFGKKNKEQAAPSEKAAAAAATPEAALLPEDVLERVNSAKNPLKVLCVCQNGVGSSVMLKVFVEKCLKSIGVTNCAIDVADSTVAGGMADGFDVVITNREVMGILKGIRKPMIGLDNMTNRNEITEKLAAWISENK